MPITSVTLRKWLRGGLDTINQRFLLKKFTPNLHWNYTSTDTTSESYSTRERNGEDVAKKWVLDTPDYWKTCSRGQETADSDMM